MWFHRVRLHTSFAKLEMLIVYNVLDNTIFNPELIIRRWRKLYVIQGVVYTTFF